MESPRLSEYQGKIKEGDADNVRATLSSYLYDAQCGDVVKAEKRQCMKRSALSSVMQQEEQADGTVKYSIKPIETADGKHMPDDPIL